MATKTNTAEVGANGDAITDANKATTTGGTAGDPFDTITISGAPTFEKTTTNPAFGTRAYHVSGGSGTTAYPRWTLNDTQLACYGHFCYNSLPSAAHTLFQTFGGGCTVNANSSNVLQLLDASGAVISGAFTGDALSASAWYRLQVTIDQHGQTTTSGDIKVEVFPKGSNMPVPGYSATLTGKNTGTANITHARMFGKQTSGITEDITFDGLALSNATTTMPTLPGANVPPVVNAGSNITCTAGVAGLHLSGTVTDSDGTVTSAAWSQVSGPDTPAISTSTSGIGSSSVTAAADVDVVVGTYVFRLTGTDSGTATATDDVTVYVHPAVDTAAPVAGVDADDWAAFGGAASALVAVTDADDATGVETADNPTGAVQDFTLPPLGLGPISIIIRGYRTAAAAITRTVTLYKNDGVTQIYQTTQTPGQSVADLPVTPDGTALAAIPTEADRTGLRLRVSSTS